MDQEVVETKEAASLADEEDAFEVLFYAAGHFVVGADVLLQDVLKHLLGDLWTHR